MQYYKYLDLEFEHVTAKLRQYYFKKEDIFKTFWTNISHIDMMNYFPELQEMFNPLGITIKTIAFVKTTKPITEIHRDYTTYQTRINLPVLNCELTETKFYTTNTEPEKLLLPNGITYLCFKEENCTQVDSLCLSKPTLIKIQELHQVCSNNPNLPRVSCTLGFNEDIEHLW